MKSLTAADVRWLQLRALDELVAFCADRGIQYMLTYGTLLGAVRHGGYIPWDDDIDILMPRPDYERFIAEFSSPDFDVVGPGSEQWPFAHAKVSHRGTSVQESTRVPHEIGVNIDVFPLDQRGSGPLARARYAAARLAVLALTLKSIAPDAPRAPHKRVTLRVGQLVLRLVPARTLSRVADRLAAAPWRFRGSVGTVLVSNPWKVPHVAAVPTSVVEFEGRELAAPADFPQVLYMAYGPDFMVPPPVEEQETHHVWVASWADS